MAELHTAPATKTQTVNPTKGDAYELVWHITEFASRAKAHKALRAEGYRWNQPSQRGRCIAGSGYWTRREDTRTAVVIGSTVRAR